MDKKENGKVMNSRFRLLAGVVTSCLLFALGGCGYASDSTSGTSTGGSVSISTDQTTYQSSDAMRVSVTNKTQTSIFSYDSRASCTILNLQVQINGSWQNSQASRCARGGLPGLVEIPAGKTYDAVITSGTPGVSSSGFPSGTYRLVLKYAPSRTAANRPMTTIYSAPFAVNS